MKRYEKSVTSQWGEDGVIEEIFCRIGANNKICVDIGAWDGKHFSNTWVLGQIGWHRIMWEKTDHHELVLFSNDIMIIEEAKSIDEQVLHLATIPTDFDFLNIDIDGDDFYLWQDMIKYKPRVICIEYNQTVPSHISIVQELGGNFGASFKALYDLGMKKGYTLVHATVTNMIFVLQEYRAFFPDFVSFPDDWVSYVAIGYNGKKYMIGKAAHNDNQDGKHEKLITYATITNL